MPNDPMVNQDITTILQSQAGEAPILLCAEHQAEHDGSLLAAMASHPTITFSQEDTDVAVQAIFHAIASHACRCLGTELVVQFKCPVCALSKFPLVPEFVRIGVEGVIKKRKQIIVPKH